MDDSKIIEECMIDFYEMEELFRKENITECKLLSKKIKDKLDFHGIQFSVEPSTDNADFTNWLSLNQEIPFKIDGKLKHYYNGTGYKEIISQLSTLDSNIVNGILTKLKISLSDIKEKIKYNAEKKIHEMINFNFCNVRSPYKVTLEEDLEKCRYKYYYTIITKVKSPSNKIKIGGITYPDTLISYANPLMIYLLTFHKVEIEKDSVLDVIMDNEFGYLYKRLDELNKSYSGYLYGKDIVYKNGLFGLKSDK